LQLERKPILCYVTDRRALESANVPSVGDPISRIVRTDPTHTLLETIRKASAAGINWIQIREKDLETRMLAELTRLAVTATRNTSTKILVNDRLDVALGQTIERQCGHMRVPDPRWRKFWPKRNEQQYAQARYSVHNSAERF